MWKLKPEEGNKGFTLVLKDCCLERLARSTCFMPVLRGSLGTTAHCESSGCLTLIAEPSPRDSLESSILLYIFPVPIFALLCVTTGSVFLSASNFPASCPGTKQSYAVVEFDQLYNYTKNVISEIINFFFLLCLDVNVWVIAVNKWCWCLAAGYVDSAGGLLRWSAWHKFAPRNKNEIRTIHVLSECNRHLTEVLLVQMWNCWKWKK